MQQGAAWQTKYVVVTLMSNLRCARAHTRRTSYFDFRSYDFHKLHHAHVFVAKNVAMQNKARSREM
jgi:hypothetical protein